MWPGRGSGIDLRTRLSRSEELLGVCQLRQPVDSATLLRLLTTGSFKKELGQFERRGPFVEPSQPSQRVLQTVIIRVLLERWIRGEHQRMQRGGATLCVRHHVGRGVRTGVVARLDRVGQCGATYLGDADSLEHSGHGLGTVSKRVVDGSEGKRCVVEWCSCRATQGSVCPRRRCRLAPIPMVQ